MRGPRIALPPGAEEPERTRPPRVAAEERPRVRDKKATTTTNKDDRLPRPISSLGEVEESCAETAPAQEVTLAFSVGWLSSENESAVLEKCVRGGDLLRIERRLLQVHLAITPAPLVVNLNSSDFLHLVVLHHEVECDEL